MPKIQSQVKLRGKTEKLSTEQRKEKPSEILMEAQGARRMGDPEKGRQRH